MAPQWHSTTMATGRPGSPRSAAEVPVLRCGGVVDLWDFCRRGVAGGHRRCPAVRQPLHRVSYVCRYIAGRLWMNMSCSIVDKAILCTILCTYTIYVRIKQSVYENVLSFNDMNQRFIDCWTGHQMNGSAIVKVRWGGVDHLDKHNWVCCTIRLVGQTINHHD